MNTREGGREFVDSKLMVLEDMAGKLKADVDAEAAGVIKECKVF